ncbi:hypothetical protein DFH08DRAFT_805052 [Mycena albidolilacea]|uniref:Uncharacterized protein n=1 Tax=Mycena albidolilacea TaxID=1033008 RepID=A0AAD7AAI7_9AGAR|nr:hypothetical protein DFH08DRAFT_805052 [Mycena albidolilacea]
MPDSFIPNTWEQLLNLPGAPVDDFNLELASFTFETHGTGNDFEVEAFPPPDRLLSTPIASSRTSPPLHPFCDLSTLPQQTPTPTLTVIGPPQTPIPSRTVLKDLNAFLPFGVNTSPFNYASARTNQFCVAADTKFRNDDQKCAFFSQNTPKERRQGGKSKKKKDSPSAVATDNHTSTRAQYSSDDLILITREVVNVNLFIAAYGQKGVLWQQIADSYLIKRYVLIVPYVLSFILTISFEDLNGKNKNLAKVIGEGTSASIIIGALLECMETQYNESTDKSDDAKAKLKAPFIMPPCRQWASTHVLPAFLMTTTPLLTRRPPVDKSTDSLATSESPTVDKSPGSRTLSKTPIEPVANTLSASLSLNILDSNDKKTKAKCCRTMDHCTSSLAGTGKLAALLKEESTRCAAHNTRMATTFETFAKDARKQKKEVTSLLGDLVNIAEKEL